MSGALRDYDATLWYPMVNPDFEEADLSKRSQELISNMKRLGTAWITQFNPESSISAFHSENTPTNSLSNSVYESLQK